MARILDPVLQQYCLDIQLLLEQNNATGMTREEIGRAAGRSEAAGAI